MQHHQIPASWGRWFLIMVCYPAEAWNRFPTPLTVQLMPLLFKRTTCCCFSALQSCARRLFLPRSPSQSEGREVGRQWYIAVVHSSYSELACDSQQISDTQPEFEQVLGCSNVGQQLTNSKKNLLLYSFQAPDSGNLKIQWHSRESLGLQTKQRQGCIC